LIWSVVWRSCSRSARSLFGHLRARALDAGIVVGALLHQLGRRQHGHQLVLGHRVAFVDQQLLDTAANLRAHDDLMRRDGAGERERRDGPVGIPVDAPADGEDHDQGNQTLEHSE
jgi:hypothetical protein